MSSELSLNDIIGKVNYDKNCVDKEGCFLKAFKDGFPILLENINFASEDILEYISKVLDSNNINYLQK